MATVAEKRLFGDVGRRLARVVPLESALSLRRTYGEKCVFVSARPDRRVFKYFRPFRQHQQQQHMTGINSG